MAYKFKNEFNEWSLSKWKRWRWSISVPIAWSVSLVARIDQLQNLITSRPEVQVVIDQYARTIPPFVNLIFICALLFTRILRTPLAIEQHEQASLAFKRLHRYWQIMWILWAVFYFVVLVEIFSKIAHGVPASAGEVWWLIIRNTLNNSQSAFVFLCYFVLAEPFASETETNDRANMFGRLMPWKQLLVFVSLMIGVEILIVATGYESYVAGRHTWFEVLGGILAGLAMALLTGRLQSKFAGAPTPVIASLYFYSLLQMTYPAFRLLETPWMEAIALSLAFPLKLMLFLFVHWLMSSGRILFYFEKVPSHTAVDVDWKKFEVELLIPKS